MLRHPQASLQYDQPASLAPNCNYRAAFMSPTRLVTKTTGADAMAAAQNAYEGALCLQVCKFSGT